MHQTKADYAANRMREALASGRYAAGERLLPRDLAAELDLSLTPVREALIELAAEGLIEMRPHRGPHVASTTVESLEEVYLLRETLEGLAAQLAAGRITPQELEALTTLHEEFTAAHRRKAKDGLAEVSDRFHMAIYGAAKAPMLVRLIKIVLAAAPSGILSSIPGRADHSLEDHTAILEALRSRDGDQARELMVRHLHDTLGFVDDYQKHSPSGAEPPGKGKRKASAKSREPQSVRVTATGATSGRARGGAGVAKRRQPARTNAKRAPKD